MPKDWVRGLRKVLKTSLIRVFEIRLISAGIETSVGISMRGKRDRNYDLLIFVIAFFSMITPSASPQDCFQFSDIMKIYREFFVREKLVLVLKKKSCENYCS